MGKTEITIAERKERAWKYLNKHGIFTEEELDERLKELPPINIGVFVQPLGEIRKDNLKTLNNATGRAL